MPEKESHTERDFRNLAVLLLIALCLGIYLIATTKIIATDGVKFIRMAQQLDTSAADVMIKEDQHPGYPWLIRMAHKMAGCFRESTSVLSWIGCAQSVSLLFRLLTLSVLYVIGKHLFTSRLSFWAILIFILLPNPAEYGSDALSDWPHLFFLTVGLLCLLKGAATQDRRFFALAGLAAGAGYLIRPECAQVVIFGSLWLGWQAIVSKHKVDKKRTATAFILMLAGFLVVAGPYMHFKGAIFPKKDVGRFVHCLPTSNVCEEYTRQAAEPLGVSQAGATDVPKAFLRLIENIGETLMWFFAVPLLVGMQIWRRKCSWCEPETFLIVTMIAFNSLLMLWLYCRHGYMSDRHTLPLLMLPILFIPSGLQEIAAWFQRRFSKKADQAAANGSEQFWFLLLLAIGACVCAPKLLEPIRVEKQGYKAAAQWLNANTASTDTIAVPDGRISFYAQREGILYEKGKIPSNTKYVVVIFKHHQAAGDLATLTGKPVYRYAGTSESQADVIVLLNHE